jgi:hypothetical protein
MPALSVMLPCQSEVESPEHAATKHAVMARAENRESIVIPSGKDALGHIE